MDGVKVMRFEKEVWRKDFEKLFLQSFPQFLWIDAKFYDFGLWAFDPVTNESLMWMTVKYMNSGEAYLPFGSVNPNKLARGYGREAMKAFVEYLSRDFRRLRFVTEATNKAMQRIAENLGFVKINEGMNRDRACFEYLKQVR